MNKIRTFALLAVALLAMAASVPALAQRGSRGGSQGGTHAASSHGGHHGHSHVSVGFAFGGPGYWGYPGWGYPGWGYAGWGYPGYYYPSSYYYPYYPYYPQVAGMPAEATAYIERSDASSPPVQQSRDHWWYYCPEAKAYYPYVKECAGGWQRVSPTPPGEIR